LKVDLGQGIPSENYPGKKERKKFPMGTLSVGKGSLKKPVFVRGKAGRKHGLLWKVSGNRPRTPPEEGGFRDSGATPETVSLANLQQMKRVSRK